MQSLQGLQGGCAGGLEVALQRSVVQGAARRLGLFLGGRCRGGAGSGTEEYEALQVGRLEASDGAAGTPAGSKPALAGACRWSHLGLE